MTTAATTTLFKLLRRGIALAVVGGRLRLSPASALDPGLRAAVARDKPDLLAWLGWLSAPADRAGFWARCASALLAGVADPERRADLRDAFEHRAGVAEFDACLGRDEAERLAFGELWQTWCGAMIEKPGQTA
jgi:hypothetical protein